MLPFARRSPATWKPPRPFTKARQPQSCRHQNFLRQAKGNISPQHAVLLGMSGAGKSVTICDLLSQTEGYFAYTVIIEEGLSYGIYTQTVDRRQAHHHSAGRRHHHQLPRHEGTAADAGPSCVGHRAGGPHGGFSQHEDKQMLRQAQIAKYINLLYEDVSRIGAQKRFAMLAMARHALRAVPLSQGKNAARRDHAGSVRRFPRLDEPNEDEAQEYLDQFDRSRSAEVSQRPEHGKDVRNSPFAYFKPDEYPTHRMLQELMYLDASGAERDQIIEIATLLAAVVPRRQLRLSV
jgi:type IV secretion system protein TrbE